MCLVAIVSSDGDCSQRNGNSTRNWSLGLVVMVLARSVSATSKKPGNSQSSEYQNEVVHDSLAVLIEVVRVIGVFDTVGSVGMPEELSLSSEKLKNIFGFPDKHLGHHVERAYQALALNEDRVDFVGLYLDHLCRPAHFS